MNKIGKNALILWICAGVCVVGGLGCFATSVGAGIFGLVLAGVLGFIGYKQYVKFKEAQEVAEAAERAERDKQKTQAAQVDYKPSSAPSPKPQGVKLQNKIIVDNEAYELIYTYKAVGVACADKAEYADAAATVGIGDKVTLKAEPSNPYDANAVALVSSSGSCFGYLYKGQKQDMANDFLRKGLPVIAIAENSPATTVTLGFYDIEQSRKNLDRLQSWHFETFKLSANSKEEMQEHITSSEVGEVVTIEYDFEKGKFLVRNSYGGEIGYINSQKLSDGEEYDACVSEVKRDPETFKYSIYVAIFNLEQ